MKSPKSFLLAVLTIFCMLLVATLPASAATSLEVSFTYDQPATAYNLFMDGVQLCSTPAGTEKKLSCAELDIPHGVHLFTMTATDSAGLETKHSPAYVWAYSPEQGEGPIMINFSVTVDGRVIKLGPVN